MPGKPLPKTELEKIFQHFKDADGNISLAARNAGLTRNTFRYRLDTIKTRYPSWFDGLTFDGATPKEPARTLEHEVKVQRAQSEARHAKGRLKEAVSEIRRLEDDLSYYETVGNLSAQPADWTLKSRSKSKSREHIPLLFTSDFQLGEVIDARETEHGYGYNAELFRSRYRRMIETTIYLSFEHAGKEWTYPGIIYARGGDTISGGIHEELAETDDLSPIEAVEVAFEEEAAGIAKLLDAFGRVEVKDCGGGNHDRTTKKPRSKGAHLNFDRLISFMLRREFANDPRVTFQNTMSMDVVFNIYEKTILLTHGDRIGSRGGQGFIGPAATVMRGAQKIIMEQSAIGRRIDMVMMGHFHTPMYLEWIMVNGSLPGYSEFAKMNRMRPHPPQQFLSYWFEGRGLVDLKPIILTEA